MIKGIKNNPTLIKEAVDCYCRYMKREEYVKSFLSFVETAFIKDLRGQGYYCRSCERMVDEPMDFVEMGHAIAINYGDYIEIKLVDTHYDGCKGWD